ncbi:MAG TPA: Si-specific NAD(P)(+) transhydrogenase [Candidatus Binataceae bacterium]|nr:Si-specific NAD(P)(+) transhydrogenase [Candidatus Binataceae bacterium]
MADFDFDLIVIGSGPAGHHAAIQAAKLRKRVMLVERRPLVGGICVNVGTIPSKTMREAVLYLSGYREHSFYGESYKVKDKITFQDLLMRVDPVVRHEIDVMRHQLLRNGVELAHAAAAFIDAHSLNLSFGEGRGARLVTTDKVIVAVGTEATRDPSMPMDGQSVYSSDDILQLRELPQSLTVIGAGVIGCEYASIFAALGVRVTVVDKRPRLLPFVDAEVIEALNYHLREKRVLLRLGEEVSRVEVIEEMGRRRVKTSLASGKQILSDKVLCSVGRTGATTGLNLDAAGVKPDSRGRIPVNEFFQTSAANIYAAGDVVGFPSLAATSMEQGRLATCHAFGIETNHSRGLFPYGIYTIPEISFVGRNEEELTEHEIPYETGKASYRELPRGQIVGDSIGFVKLLFHRETRELLGIHIIGEDAVELVHIGQAVLALGGRIDYFIDTVFNYPTLAQCYKNAAFDGLNRLTT